METTLGQLVTKLYDVLEKRYGRGELAALATQVVVTDLLCRAEQHHAHRRAPPRNSAAGATQSSAQELGVRSPRSSANDARALAPP
jgi:hypothetical protein